MSHLRVRRLAYIALVSATAGCGDDLSLGGGQSQPHGEGDASTLSDRDAGGGDASGGDAGRGDAAADGGPVGPALALTPPMGWNSWNKFGVGITEALIEQTADAMVSSGMQAAGYRYVNLDDGWQAVSRDATGQIVADPTAFPGGIATLAAYVHGKGLKLGIYTCAGIFTCGGRLGSYGYEAQDANTYASWGVDYVKEDWCATGTEDPQTVYTTMHDALIATGRPIVFSICDWGVSSPWSWGPSTGNLWRATGDISDSFGSMLANLDSTAEHASAAGPGHWNDPDMLEVGNGGMTSDEYRSHFSLWAILAAPLIAGNDLTQMSADTLATLTNAEVIAIDQDAAGIQGTLVADDGRSHQVWSRPLAAPGTRAVALFNRDVTAATITASFSDLGLAVGSASVRDLWQHQDLGVLQGSYSALVAPHATVMVTVFGDEGAPRPAPATYPASASTSTLAGAAVLATCGACATGQKVSSVGNGGTLQWNGVQAVTAGTKTIVINYLSGSVGSAEISVNGGSPLTVPFGGSGPNGDYDVVGTHVLQVPLNAGANTILVSNPTGPAPDFDAIDVFE